VRALNPNRYYEVCSEENATHFLVRGIPLDGQPNPYADQPLGDIAYRAIEDAGGTWTVEERPPSGEYALPVHVVDPSKGREL
jgi:hypothetical protein